MDLSNGVFSATSIAIGQKRHCLSGYAPIAIDLGLDPKAQKQHLHLPEQSQRCAVERDILGLVSIVSDCTIRRKQPTKHSSGRSAVECKEGIRKRFVLTTFVHYCQPH